MCFLLLCFCFFLVFLNYQTLNSSQCFYQQDLGIRMLILADVMYRIGPTIYVRDTNH